MKRAKKPTLFYFLGALFLIFSLVNQVNDSGQMWAAFLSSASFIIAFKKHLRYRAQNQHDEKVYARIKNGYLSSLEENNTKKSDIDLTDIAWEERIPNEIVKSFAQKAVKSIMDETVHQETSSGSLSPEGYNKILRTAEKLNTELKINAQTQKDLDTLRRYWSIEHEPLSPISVEISLHKDEVCYYENACRWLEHRTETKSVSYSGLSASFKITKGIRYRVGNVKPQRITSDVLKEIDRGKLLITNQRIIFMGAGKNTTIKLPAILSITPYTDGVGVEKDSGKSPILMTTDPDILARILSRMMNQNK